MSVEALSPSRTIETMSPQDVREVVEALWQLPPAQARESYEQLATLFHVAHEQEMEATQEELAKQEAAINKMLDHSSESFVGEFKQLQMMYSERTIYTQLRNGSQIAAFCLQDHETNQPDYMFKMRVDPTGIPVYSVTKMVDTEEGVRRPMTYLWRHGEAQVSVPRFDVKGRPYTETFEGHDAERQFATLFHDTLKASGLQLNRSADDRERYDGEAKQLVTAEYEGLPIADSFQSGTVVLE